MKKIIRTDSANLDFVRLVKKLDAYLAVTDGSEHDFYNQYNKIDSLKHVILLYENEIAVGCGAMKELSAKVMEVKRMYTAPNQRGKGIATDILSELEKWAVELSYEKCILETGLRQVEAVQFYKKNNYQVIPNYGQYAGMNNSICFEKELKR